MRVDLSRAARTELRAAARYYEDQQDGLGVAFQREIRSVLELIAGQPELSAVVPDLPEGFVARRFSAT